MENSTTPSPVKAANFLQSIAFNALLKVAQNFCTFIENETGVNKNEFVQNARKHVAALYSAALQIPKLAYDNNGSDIDNSFTEETKNSRTKSIYSRTPFQYYWITLKPFQLDGEIETGLGDLGDDLLDIYKDLKKSLLAYNSPGEHARERALWLLAFGFNYHWGQHCVDALRAIHHYLHDPK